MTYVLEILQARKNTLKRKRTKNDKRIQILRLKELEEQSI